MARALASSGDIKRSLEYAEKARVVSRENLADQGWALRQLGWIQIQNGLIEQGTKTYDSALDRLKSSEIDKSLPWVINDRVETHVDRGTILAIMSQCAAAKSDHNEFRLLFPYVIQPGDRKFFQQREGLWNEILERQCGKDLDLSHGTQQ